MAEGAGRSALLKWLNEFYQIGYTKVEQCASGAVHCQIMDSIYPGKINLSKVNFEAKHEYEFVQNYKVLQHIFNEQNIAKHIEVEKLIKAKYQDNLEFLQWMKTFFDQHYPGQPYDGKARREDSKKKGGKVGAAAAAPAPKAAAAPAAAPAAAKPARPAAAPAKAAAPAAAKQIKPKAAGVKDDGKKSDEVAELQAQVARLRGMVEGLEKERNFYFGKLREIEILCQTEEEVDAATKQDVLKILYKTDGDEEFQAPAEGETAAAAEDA